VMGAFRGVSAGDKISRNLLCQGVVCRKEEKDEEIDRVAKGLIHGWANDS